jgi:pimaricinolide synthase PimS1
MVPLAAEQGLALFDAALASPRTELVPIRIDTATVAQHPEAAPALFRGLVEQAPRRTRAARTSAPAEASPRALADVLAELDEDERRESVLATVVGEVAAVLGHSSADRVDPRRSFAELGFDSLTAVELRNRLGPRTGLRLAPTLIFDHPTPEELGGHLYSEIAPALVPAPRTPVGADAPGQGVLAEIGRLEAALAGATVPGDEHREVTERLRNLVSAWESVADDRSREQREIEAASADEIFALLDSELES